MIGMNGKDIRKFQKAKTKMGREISEQRHGMVLAYLAAFQKYTGRPVEEIELREFQKSSLEVSFRFVTKDETDQQIIQTLRHILTDTMSTTEAKVEKLAAMLGVEKYD